MENNERDRKLEQWLDEALSQYSAAEPRLGLEQRVLAHIGAEQQARAGRTNWWRWMPAFAAIAAVVIVAVAVKPYWDGQTVQTKPARETASVAPQKSVSDEVADRTTENTDSELTRERKKQSLNQKREAPEVRRDGGAAIPEADKQVPAKKDGIVVPVQPKSERETSVLANSNEALQAKGAAVADLKSTKSVQVNNKQPMNYFALPATSAPDSAAPGRTNEPASAGVIANGNAVVPKPSKDPRTIISVDGPRPVVQVQDETVEVTTAAEKVTAVPASTGAMRAMKVHANPKGPLAKKLEENVESGYTAGLVAGKELKKASANSAKQFPSPAPLTKEEQLLLSAAKNLKDADASQDKQKKTESNINAVEIKQIEIAPLPGPPK